RNYLKFFPDRRLPHPELRVADLGLIKLKPGIKDLARVRRELEDFLPDDVEVLTMAGLIERERTFWRQHTPVGFVLQLGMGMGLAVGVMIGYQVLSNDITHNLKQYATLKAIGYGMGRLIGCVFWEALILAVFGYIPGWLVSRSLYQVLAEQTGLPMNL